MNRCHVCGGKVRVKRVPEFRDDALLGLPGVVLVDSVDEWTCEACGEGGITIPNLEGLTAAIVTHRVMDPRKLAGGEIRFIRGAMGMESGELAIDIGVRRETLSRWENQKEPIGPASEKLLRMLALYRFGKDAPGVERDEEQALRMKIRAVEAHKKPIGFQLLPMLVKKKRRPVWSAAKAA